METNKRQCKVCKVLKDRIETGKWNPEGKDKKFVDEHGKAWNGNVCPPCHKDNVKVKTRDRRKIA